MTKTIFRNTFLVGMSVLLLCGALFFGLQYTQIKEETYAALQQESVYAEQGMLLSGTEYLEKLGDTNRVTWIREDGAVLYDSEEGTELPGQLDCEEVSEARTTGEGQSIRKSEQDGVTAMYYARLCQDGTVLRLSRPMSAVRYALVAVSPVLWICVLVLMISGVLAFRAAKQIVEPINGLDLDDPNPDTYPELTPLITRIQEQKLTIQEEVEQREQLRREFSANVSHELKTPLTAISGFAELMKEGMVPPEQVKEFAGDIYDQSRRLMALVEDILDLSRLEENTRPRPMTQVDLSALAGRVVRQLEPVADRFSIRLEQELAPCTVLGDESILEEMLYNLIDNAIKYNRPGGWVRVSTGLRGSFPFACVADNGIGIPPDEHERVFERFYRVDKSRSRAMGGTGLGLSIVKHGATYHNARLSLDSAPGKGSRVTLTFSTEKH